MIKYKYESVNLWISQEDGSLNIEHGEHITILPYKEGKELLKMLKTKQGHFEEAELEKSGWKNKVNNFFTVKPESNDW